MGSRLRAKLNALGAVSPSAPRQVRPSGVLVYADRRPADPRLFHMDGEGLRRIGWCGLALDPRRVLFLDTETTGLSGGAGTVAFLVGLGWLEGDQFVVEQYLMRDYSDEPELLSRVAEKLCAFDAVCTFNGRNFDLPLLQARFTLCRMRELWRDLPQLDLLYPSRRTWKLRIGSCRLSRVEEFILGAPRGEDIPGAEVPQRFFDYIKTGDLSLLEDIVSHNRQDVATLGVLLAHLCELYAHPEAEVRRPDQLSIGAALERQGELKPARELYRVASIPAPAGSLKSIPENALASRAAWRLYLLVRKSGDAEAMREQLERMANRRQCREKIYVELAKLYEHRYKNPRRALRYADLAARYVPESEREALSRRRERLCGKIEKERMTDHGLL